MSHPVYKRKTIECLLLQAFQSGDCRQTYCLYYQTLCGRYGEKVVCSKLLSLYNKEYLEDGVSIMTSHLTEKGVKALRDNVSMLADDFDTVDLVFAINKWGHTYAVVNL